MRVATLPRPRFVLLALLAVTATTLAATPCNLMNNTLIANGENIAVTSVSTPAECCTVCNENTACRSWTVPTLVQPPAVNCFLHGTATNITTAANHVSGLRSEPLPALAACQDPAGPGGSLPFCDSSLSMEARVSDLVSRVNESVKANLLTARGHGGKGINLQALPELGVPEYYWGTNCLHSLNQVSCIIDPATNKTRCPTDFPSGPSMAATFDRSIVAQLGNIVGQELRVAYKMRATHTSIDCWGPVLNLNRDPRWGRNGEGGAEDPFLMGQIAAAWTRGFQNGEAPGGVQDPNFLQGVLTLKHMDVNSLEDSDGFTRHTFDANVSNYMLADYYFVPFKQGIRAGARGIMCSYNSVQGIPTCLSPLMAAARKAWGFQGYVTSDSDSVADAWASHHYVKTPEEASCLAVADGLCDIDSGDTYYDNLINATRRGLCKMADVDAALHRSLSQRFSLGLFDNITAQPYWQFPASYMGSESSANASYTASVKSLVLLENRGVLPVTAGRRLAVIGPHLNASGDMMQPDPSTPYCPDGTSNCIVTPLAALSAANARAGGTTTSALGCTLFGNDTSGFDEAVAKAKAADTVVLFLGIEVCVFTHGGPTFCEQGAAADPYLESEAHDRRSIDLPPTQHALAKAILDLGKPTVIVLMNAGMVAVDAEKAHPGPLAIVEAFYPGPYGGLALADALFGVTNRWGRLPYTIYPADWINETPMSEHDLTAGPGRTYKYYKGTPLYTFGHGLSLTNFSVAAGGSCPTHVNLTTTSQTNITVTLAVTNTGTRKGDVVLEAFFLPQSLPTLPDNVLRKQLFDYQRIDDVAGGATVTVSFVFGVRDLAVVDNDGNIVAAPGSFTLLFTDGSGAATAALEIPASVTGKMEILEPFPAP